MAIVIKHRAFFSALALADRGVRRSRPAAGTPGSTIPSPARPPVRPLHGSCGQQQADGGFEVAGFPGFETSDAILAIAENAQTELTWNPAQARAAVANVVRGGKTPLDAIDDFADGPITAGQAAKLIVLVAKPLGYAPEAFNPQNDGTTRNLVSVMNAGATPNGSYGAFNATLYAAIAQKLVTGAVPANTLALIRADQEASGGWDFNGNPTADATPPDIDTTSLAMQALVSGGATRTDADLREGLAFLATAQRPNGAFQSFGVGDPNSTSTAIFAIVASGYDPTTPCWRNVASPALAAQPYTSPLDWLRSKQWADGHIGSPNDSFGLEHVRHVADHPGASARLGAGERRRPPAIAPDLSSGELPGRSGALALDLALGAQLQQMRVHLLARDVEQRLRECPGRASPRSRGSSAGPCFRIARICFSRESRCCRYSSMRARGSSITSPCPGAIFDSRIFLSRSSVAMYCAMSPPVFGDTTEYMPSRIVSPVKRIRSSSRKKHRWFGACPGVCSTSRRNSVPSIVSPSVIVRSTFRFGSRFVNASTSAPVAFTSAAVAGEWSG